MWWRASLLFLAVLLGSIVCARQQPLGRAVFLELPDGSLARDVEVHWLDVRGRVGEAELNPDGSWSIPEGTEALEVTGDAVADTIHECRDQRPRIQLYEPARLVVHVQGPTDEDWTGQRLLAFASFGTRKPAIRWKPVMETVWNDLGRNPDGRMLHPHLESFRSGRVGETHEIANAWRGGKASSEWWTPARAEQLVARIGPDGTAVFEDLPRGSAPFFRVSAMPSDPWVVVDSRPELDADFGKGESKRIELRDEVTTVDLELARWATLELRIPATRDLARTYLLEVLQPGVEPEVQRWSKVGFAAGYHALSHTPGRIEFQRLLPGEYRIQVAELSNDEHLVWYAAEGLRLEPRTGHTLAESETDPPAGGPLKLRFEDQYGTDLMGEHGPSPSSALRRSLLKPVTLELREFDDLGNLLHASRHEARVRADGNLLPAPWIPSARPVQIAILPEYAQDVERSGPWRFDRTELVHTVDSQPGAPCSLTLKLDSGGRTRARAGLGTAP